MILLYSVTQVAKFIQQNLSVKNTQNTPANVENHGSNKINKYRLLFFCLHTLFIKTR